MSKDDGDSAMKGFRAEVLEGVKGMGLHGSFTRKDFVGS